MRIVYPHPVSARPLTSACLPSAVTRSGNRTLPTCQCSRTSRHCCTSTVSRRLRCSAEGGVQSKGGGGVRGAHSALLAVGRCLAGSVCTVLQGAQLRAAGRRAARGGGSAARLWQETSGEEPHSSHHTGCTCAGDLPATLSSLSTRAAMPAAHENTRVVSRMARRHRGHVGVLVRVSCSAHPLHTHWWPHGRMMWSLRASRHSTHSVSSASG
jgi:hypothetical protein